MKDIIFGIVRHLLTVFGGILVSKGYTDETTVTSVVGAVMTIVGFVWSIWNKKKSFNENKTS